MRQLQESVGPCDDQHQATQGDLHKDSKARFAGKNAEVAMQKGYTSLCDECPKRPVQSGHYFSHLPLLGSCHVTSLLQPRQKETSEGPPSGA